eukprot:Blabericola_migrator_1__8256@NODE_427_length_8589_cov_62_998123_g337_i0_p4_GENE_NODE_427_length_8589_cov_62_998123_g337_i0NODE_427_length_8589_cov_62_998123_g337_i0_p4_ORF_typecomplete_len308_score28_18CDC27/PF09507_10/0_0065DUF2957/PF11170_8/0_066_NODE_427_length_8589_cov_62_998123_g337_i022413164
MNQTSAEHLYALEGIIASKIALARAAQTKHLSVHEGYPSPYVQLYPSRPRISLTPGGYQAPPNPKSSRPPPLNQHETSVKHPTCASTNATSALKKQAGDLNKTGTHSSPSHSKFSRAVPARQKAQSSNGSASTMKVTAKNTTPDKKTPLKKSIKKKACRRTGQPAASTSKKAPSTKSKATKPSAPKTAPPIRILTLEHWKFVSHKEQFGAKVCETDADRLERAKMKLKEALADAESVGPSPKLLRALIRGDDRLSSSAMSDKDDRESDTCIGMTHKADDEEMMDGEERQIPPIASPSISQIKIPLSR